jgi:hypothetical protein
MRRSLLLFLLPLLAAAPAWACDAGKGEQPLFSCETENEGQFIAICAIETEPGQKWEGIHYEYGTGERPSFVYPAAGADGAKSMYFSHVKKASTYTITIRFVSEGITYRVYSKAVSEMDGEAGVTIDNTARPSMTSIACIERPYMFPDYLRRALACDLENPQGARACEENPPEEP